LVAQPPQEIKKEGFIFKLGGRLKSKWQKRWYTVGTDSFAWYEAPKGKKKGMVMLNSVVAVNDVQVHVHKKENCFTLVLPKKTYFLYTETDADRKQWMSFLVNKK